MKAQLRNILLASFAVMLVFSGWRMWTDYQDEQLWGYWPLLFFTGCWGAIRLALALRRRRSYKNWYLLGLSTLSGILLGLAFPPFPFTFLIFVGFVPLFIVVYKSKSLAEVWTFSYNTFVIWNILATYWVANTAFIAGIVAVWLNAFFMTIPVVAFYYTKKYIPRLAFFGFISFWLSFEMLHLHWELSWSWLNLGNAFSRFPVFIQWYEYTGTFGGTLWALMANVLIYKIYKYWQEGSYAPLRYRIAQLAFLILVPVGLSLFLFYNYKNVGKPVEVVVIQPNFEPHYEKFAIPDSIQLQRFLRLADSLLSAETEYLLFPETSFGIVEINSMEANPQIVALQSFLQKYPRLKLVTGVDSYRILAPDAPSTPYTREQNTGGGYVMRYELYNGAIQIDGERLDHYKKSKLVPGAEIFPYKNLLFFFKPLVEKLGGSAAGFGIQKQRSVFKSNTGSVAPVICYESVFGEYCTRYVQRGAEAIFIMTNDGWWDATAGHRQHLYYATLRAIETRKPIARSANTGISAFINQRGEILQPTRYDEATAIKGQILFNNKITFYTIWGDIIGRVSIFATIILLLNLFVKSRTERG